jgi:hypothetical protein
MPRVLVGLQEGPLGKLITVKCVDFARDLADAHGQNGEFALEGNGLLGGALPVRRCRLDAFIGMGAQASEQRYTFRVSMGNE